MGEGKIKLCIISDSYQMICLRYYYSSNSILRKLSKFSPHYCSHTSYNIKTIMLLIPHHENICMQKYLGVMPFMNCGETYISRDDNTFI